MRGHIGVGDLGQQCPRRRPGDGQTAHLRPQRHIAHRSVLGQVGVEPALVVALGDAGAEQHERLAVAHVGRDPTDHGARGPLGPPRRGRQAGHGQVADEVARRIGHRRERHAARHRDPPGQQPVEPHPGSRTGEQELGETGGLHQADGGPHGQRLGPHPVRLGHRHQLGLHPQVAAPGVGHLEPVEPLGRVGQHHAAGHVDAAVLAGDPLDLGVQLGGVALQAGHVGIAVEGVHAARAVPGGAGGELGALHQHHVVPTRLGEVVEHAGAHHSPADHHHPGLGLHGCRSQRLNHRYNPGLPTELAARHHP